MKISPRTTSSYFAVPGLGLGFISNSLPVDAHSGKWQMMTQAAESLSPMGENQVPALPSDNQDRHLEKEPMESSCLSRTPPSK